MGWERGSGLEEALQGREPQLPCILVQTLQLTSCVPFSNGVTLPRPQLQDLLNDTEQWLTKLSRTSVCVCTCVCHGLNFLPQIC